MLTSFVRNGQPSTLSNHSSDSEGSAQDHMVAGLNPPGADQPYGLLTGAALFEAIDYEQKKLLATKGMLSLEIFLYDFVFISK